MKGLIMAAIISTAPAIATAIPKCPAGAPYCMTGYGEGVLPYWGREGALADAKKRAGEGFPIEVWTSFGAKIFPAN